MDVRGSSIMKTYPKINRFTAMTRSQSFQLETNALTRLRDNYKCHCYNTHNSHFPVIQYADPSKSVLIMSHCGKTLNEDGVREEILNSMTYAEIQRQVDCIVNNLKRADVKHVDCPTNGQNICWDGKSIALIDFDICMIGENVENKTVKKWAKLYGQEDEYHRKFAMQLLGTLTGKFDDR